MFSFLIDIIWSFDYDNFHTSMSLFMKIAVWYEWIEIAADNKFVASLISKVKMSSTTVGMG